METKITEKIFKGLYFEAEQICLNMNFNLLRDIMMNMAYDTESMCIYSFLRYMVEKNKTKDWLELIIDIMINPLCFVEGAYSIALFHTRELMKIDSSVSTMEKFLFFFNIPEKLVGKSEAELVANKIIQLEPNNFVALEIFR